jgi:hypothetical protein
MFRTIALLAVVALFVTLAPPVAQSNSMSSGTRVKIHRAKLRAAIAKSQNKDSQALDGCDNGNVDIGSIQIERGGRIPREVVVVVDGDVINLNDGRGSRVCR